MPAADGFRGAPADRTIPHIEDVIRLPLPNQAAHGIFHHLTIHGSQPNRSQERRINFLIDLLPTNAKREGSRESATLIAGVDMHNHFDHEPRPPEDLNAAIERQRQVLINRNEKSYAGSKHVSPVLQ